MDEQTKKILSEYLTRSFREGAEAAMISAVEAFRGINPESVIRVSVVIEMLQDHGKFIASRQGLPLGKE